MFFGSDSYLRLEKQYRSMMMIDVTRCFDSIYSHAIGWATLGREASKTDTNHTNAICRRLDKLMQRSNNGITNGIPIGAETSRVFAEIILQSIDVEIEKELLRNHQFSFKAEYVIQRYVDDYYIFANSESDCDTVAAVISKNLQAFNLHVNEGKKERFSRPFSTARSRITQKAVGEIERLESVLGDASEDGQPLEPKVKSRRKVVNEFVGRVREMCGDSDADYSSVSSFLIGAFQKRVGRVCSTEYNDDFLRDNQLTLRNNLLVYVELSFYYFFADPQVSSSGRLARSIMLADRFIRSNLEGQLDFFRSFVSENIADLVKKLSNEGVPHTSNIEILNIILSSSEFGEHYLLPINLLKKATNFDGGLSYFEIATILHYVKRHDVYSSIRIGLEQRLVVEVESNIERLPRSSEYAHLFLDSIGCPYLTVKSRKRILNKYLKHFEGGWFKLLSKNEKELMLDALLERYWFVKWEGLDLVKVLERQELKSGY
ncbi:MAG: hypothetical protein DHS20C12_05470 [Pseudohongiella sp.]|nr:MAG: hypothetical protein DHS20C12_05470 [Pseudohongiella sp.]